MLKGKANFCVPERFFHCFRTLLGGAWIAADIPSPAKNVNIAKSVALLSF